MKYIIYTDEIDLADWSDFLEEVAPDADESTQWALVCDEVSELYDCEHTNLDRILPGHIVAVYDLGLWNGRRRGVRVLDSNLNSILGYCEDCNEWYVDDGEVWSANAHHDGTNYVNYRFLPETENDALDDYDWGEIGADELLAHTTPLGGFVAEVYGWEEK